LCGSTLTVVPTDAACNRLTVGLFPYTTLFRSVKDAQGATVAQTETITITGTNDAPTVTAALTSTAAEGAPSYALDLLSGASDAEDRERTRLNVSHDHYADDGGSATSTEPAGVS